MCYRNTDWPSWNISCGLKIWMEINFPPFNVCLDFTRLPECHFRGFCGVFRVLFYISRIKRFWLLLAETFQLVCKNVSVFAWNVFFSIKRLQIFLYRFALSMGLNFVIILLSFFFCCDCCSILKSIALYVFKVSVTTYTF